MICLVLLSIGAALNPLNEIPQEIAQANMTEVAQKNSTLMCGTNEDTQIYCTAFAFSVISGPYGSLLSLWILCQLFWNKKSSNHLGFVFFLAYLLSIGIGLWSEVLSLPTAAIGLNIANLIFQMLGFCFWSLIMGLMIYSPLCEKKGGRSIFFSQYQH